LASKTKNQLAVEKSPEQKELTDECQLFLNHPACIRPASPFVGYRRDIFSSNYGTFHKYISSIAIEMAKSIRYISKRGDFYMFVNFIILFALLGLVFLLGLLTRKAWRANNKLVKWAGSFFSGLLTLVVSLVSVLAIAGTYKFYNPPHNPAPQIQVEGTQEQIERGQHLTSAFCAECHSTTKDFPLTGGVDIGSDLPINLGSYYSANLTPAGPLKDWTDGEIFRALRENVNNNGKRLVFMNGTNVRYISDEDILAIIAFLRSQEPAEHDVPERLDQPSFLGLILFGANIIPDRPLIDSPIIAPVKEPTAEYGKFMVSFLDCTSCHGADLNGSTSSVGPKAPSLRAIRGWTQEQFITTLRTGVTPGGHELSSTMPWKSTGRLDDVELSALYQYLISLP
jgi:mono/diheme cytochrome c family protein